jgi:hypothetical protein
MNEIVKFARKWLVFKPNAREAMGVVYGGRLMLWSLFWAIICSHFMNSERTLLAIVISQALTYLFFVLNALLTSSDS